MSMASVRPARRTTMRVDRRTFLAGVPGALLAACSARGARRVSSAASLAAIDDLETARAAARFIRGLALPMPHGLSWRKSPDDPGTHDADLYHGSPGPAVFFLELYRATGERAALDEALA